MIQAPTRVRVDNPARWMEAAERAVSEDIQVRQLVGSGQWIASSGSDAAVAYELAVTGNVAHGCDCLAGINGDPCCKHKAAFYLLIGAIELTPEPDPPALGGIVDCPECQGCGVLYDRNLERAGRLYPDCPVCQGTGTMLVPAGASVALSPAAVAA